MHSFTAPSDSRLARFRSPDPNPLSFNKTELYADVAQTIRCDVAVEHVPPHQPPPPTHFVFGRGDEFYDGDHAPSVKPDGRAASLAQRYR